MEIASQVDQVLGSIAFADASRCHCHVGRIVFGHHGHALVVDVIVVAVVGFDAQDGQSLRDVDVDAASRCLIALHDAHERVFLQCFLQTVAIDLLHQLAHRINLLLLQDAHHFIGVDESRVAAVNDDHVHFLAARAVSFPRYVGKDIEEIGNDPQQYEQFKECLHSNSAGFYVPLAASGGRS